MVPDGYVDGGSVNYGHQLREQSQPVAGDMAEWNASTTTERS